MAKGCRVTVASRKMIVRPARRMLRAISFGVFCRAAPSTSAIMRSRKVSPGRAVMRTTISSDSTLVPPVTAERSPPDSRITGADSPVMADSSTLAMPSITSPSPGITSPAVTTHSSPTSSCGTRHHFDRAAPADAGPRCRTAPAAASRPGPCPAPRPWPRRSWRTATVNHSQAATRPAKRFSSRVDEPRSRRKTRVVTTLPTSTTIITGLRAMWRGWSLAMLARSAWPTTAASKEPAVDGARRWSSG